MRMPQSIVSVSVLICTTLIPSPVQSQANSVTQRPEGFWITAATGLRVDSWGEQVQPSAFGHTVVLRAGGTLSRRWRLGGELIHWTAAPDGLRSVRENTTVAAFYYPTEAVNAFVKAGMGMSIVQEDVAVDGAPPIGISTEAVAVTPGFGIDVPVSSALMFTSSLDWLLAFGHGRNRGTSSIMVLGVGLTLR